ncbi:MAG TPA: fused MFS/spermidine synthase, partial [Pyrinomonadaceae bacterium]|nr:fused MFS/spermidine synthase [Pyrinomonadaceae bacterium]
MIEPNSITPQVSSSANWRLKLVVVISGAVLMGLEMAGSRVLATFFGSSIYVWGAIISIFLAALSVGYFVGGMVADRRPDFNVLIYLLLFDGIWLLLIPIYANSLCRAILSLGPGQRLGPLLSTLLLFGGPSVLLGMVSPFAVRLAARSVQQMGNISGSLYALSTLGSIAGTLITAFWLVPAIGVRAILQILGISLLILPLLVVIPLRRKIWFVVIAFLISSASIVGSRASLRPTTDRKIVYEADSAYHHILVIDDVQRKTRFLQFNNYVEGGIDLDPPYETRLSYSNAFQLARIFKQKIDNILIIGGGGGIVARKFVTDDPNVVVDQVELDPRVVEVSHK